MIQGLCVSLVIPTHNEARGIAAVIAQVPAEVDEILIVDWASDDGTPDIAAQAGARVIHEPRRGYGRAYLTGVPAAQGDIVATADADGTYPVQRIPQLVAQLLDNKLDFISCARFPLDRTGSMARRNRIGNRLLTATANGLFGLHLDDLLSGMWVFQKDCWQQLAPQSPTWNMSQEVKLRAATTLGPAFAERWIPYASRLGDSKLSPLAVGRENLLHLLQLRWELRGQRPDAGT